MIAIDILSLIYPNVCGFCGKLDKNSLCKKCEVSLKDKILFKIDKYNNKYFNKHFYIFKYNGEVRGLLLNYKFNDKPYLYKTIVNFLKNNKKIIVQLKKYDIILPVPISKKRKFERGYNQSSLFIKEIATMIGLNYKENLLIKIKNNNPQSKLGKEERNKNVENAYFLRKKENIINKKVLLVDDIFTTGNTVNECAKMLINAKAKEVDVLTIAKD